MPRAAARTSITQADFEALAGFRQALRRFLSFSAAAARQVGLSPEQHQALLAIKGFGGGGRPTMGELAERLGRRHHSTVGLVDRLGRRGLVRRLPDRSDRRRVHVRLTPPAEALLAQLTRAHRDELRRLRPELRRLLEIL